MLPPADIRKRLAFTSTPPVSPPSRIEPATETRETSPPVVNPPTVKFPCADAWMFPLAAMTRLASFAVKVPPFAAR